MGSDGAMQNKGWMKAWMVYRCWVEVEVRGDGYQTNWLKMDGEPQQCCRKSKLGFEFKQTNRTVVKLQRALMAK